MKDLRVLVADDHAFLRQGLQELIELQQGWKVCGQAETGTQAVKEARRLRPDIVVVDLMMPGLNGIEVTRQIRRHLPACEVLIFTGSESDKLIREVFESGAKSYILKTDVTTCLIDALKSLSEHKPYFTDNASEVIFARFIHAQNEKPGSAASSEERLSPAESKLVKLLAEGYSNSDAAKKLRVSVRTVENERAGIMHKLKLHSFPDLIRYAVRNQIIEI